MKNGRVGVIIGVGRECRSAFGMRNFAMAG